MSTSSDTQDAPSSVDQSTTSKDDLLTCLIDAYWCDRNNSLTMHSKQRMVAVLELLAAEIRSWAPDKGHARICYLAINEVADRLIRESTNDVSA